MATLGTKISRESERLSGEYSAEMFTDTTAIVGSRPSLPGKRSLFVITDLLAVWLGGFLALSLRFSFHLLRDPLDYPATLPTHMAFVLLYSGLVVLFSDSLGLYSNYQSMSGGQEAFTTLKSVVMANVLLTGCIYISGIKFISRLVIAVTMLFALLGMASWRYLRRRRITSASADGLTCHNVVIVGTGRVAQAVRRYLAHKRHLGFVVSGFLSCGEPGTAESVLGQLSSPSDVLGHVSSLADVCRAHFIDEVIVCAQDPAVVKEAVAEARRSRLGVRVIPDLYDGPAGSRAQIEYIGELPSLTLNHRRVPHLALALKRALDILLASLALFLLSPFALLIAILIKLDSKGPILYSSKRVGKKGRIFDCYKFRTMVADAETRKAEVAHLNERDGVLFKIANDPRVTRIGLRLRKYSLDEIPQLWNVLSGDMSLVGPRPPLAREVEQYELGYLRRLDVAPGITGLWQVEARRHPSFDRYIALDLQYVEQWNLLLDLKIIWRTVGVVFAGTGQ